MDARSQPAKRKSGDDDFVLVDFSHSNDDNPQEPTYCKEDEYFLVDVPTKSDTKDQEANVEGFIRALEYFTKLADQQAQERQALEEAIDQVSAPVTEWPPGKPFVSALEYFCNLAVEFPVYFGSTRLMTEHINARPKASTFYLPHKPSFGRRPIVCRVLECPKEGKYVIEEEFERKQNHQA